MNLSDFDFTLPEKSIAQTPTNPRDHAKLMVIHRKEKTIEHKHFYDLPDLLPKESILVRNNSKVIKSRLRGSFASGSTWELFFIQSTDTDTGLFLVRPGKKFKKGTQVELRIGTTEYRVDILEEMEDGSRKILWNDMTTSLLEFIQQQGEMPLPPYISTRSGDEETRYQTVYAEHEGSLAAPTAGLHFTDKTFDDLSRKQIPILDITLHVGLGTFLPVKTDVVEEHTMHEERYSIAKQTWELLQAAKEQGKKICAVGTTSTRVLEHVWKTYPNNPAELEGTTDIFIYPPYTFQAVDILLTNFHLPKSTLIMLVSAFVGDTAFTLHAYQEAISQGYRFYSYGDAMLIL